VITERVGPIGMASAWNPCMNACCGRKPRNKEFCTQCELRLLRQIIISMDLYLPRTTARCQAAEQMPAL
jgi:hypothetical protein